MNTTRGRTSTEAKKRWNNDNYDRIYVYIPKGNKDAYKEYAEQHGMSLNALIQTALEQYTRENP